MVVVVNVVVAVAVAEITPATAVTSTATTFRGYRGIMDATALLTAQPDLSRVRFVLKTK